MSPPDLTPPAQAILRFMLQRKTARGGEFLSLTGFRSPEDLVEPVRELLNRGLMEAVGLTGPLDPESALFASYLILPSAERTLREMVKW
jgi:hypothetical protein